MCFKCTVAEAMLPLLYGEHLFLDRFPCHQLQVLFFFLAPGGHDGQKEQSSVDRLPSAESVCVQGRDAGDGRQSEECTAAHHLRFCTNVVLCWEGEKARGQGNALLNFGKVNPLVVKT